jgi:site-specific DNA recombinase
VAQFSVGGNTAFDFLANPCKLWASGHLEARRTVLKLAFTDRLAYARGTGLRTGDLSLPFKLLGELGTTTRVLVGPEGFEPSTNGLRVRCSTN